MDLKSISSLPLSALRRELAPFGAEGYRADQVFTWLHQKRAGSFGDMTNLPAALRTALSETYRIDAPEIVKKLRSKDGTVKYLMRLVDGNHVESSLMKYAHGNSICVSSQAGCRMGCRFCAQTAQNEATHSNLVRSLAAGEIAGQVYAALAESGEAINHVVLMGIGEPLDNFDAVVDFFRIITDARGQNLSGRHVSLSTCGLVPQINRLAELSLPLTLSISLHAPTDAKRGEIMPVNAAYPIRDLVEACAAYQQTTGRRVSYEYAVMPGFNDSAADADALARLLKKSRAHINLIPLNPVANSSQAGAADTDVRKFQTRLIGLGMNVTVRRRLGADIEAACGQLRKAEEGEYP